MRPLTVMTRWLMTLATAAALVLPVAFASTTLYVLDPLQSEARFLIGENLLGRETTAVGSTQAVSGEVTIDLDSLTASFGVFEVDVSTLTTDDRMRDGQIRNSILQTNRAGNATVTFVPTTAEGLELPLVAGTAQNVQLVGDLTIKGVTRQVVFDLVLNVVSDTELRGTATTVVMLEEFGISVPRVPLVARVDDNVTLLLDFRLVTGP